MRRNLQKRKDGGRRCRSGKAAGIVWVLFAVLALSLSVNFLTNAAENVTLKGNSISFEKEGEKYIVDTQEKLEALGNASAAETRDKTFILKSNLTVTDLKEAKNGIFAGTFDGGEYGITISDSQISESGTTDASKGLIFGTVTGTVENLIIDLGANVSYTYTANADKSASEPIFSSTGSWTADPLTAGTYYYRLLKNGQETGDYLTTEPTSGSYHIYKKVSATRTGTLTKTYTNNASGKEIFLGVLAGKIDSNGAVSKVSINGELQAVQLSERYAASGKAQATQSGDAYYLTTKVEKADGDPILKAAVFSSNDELTFVQVEGQELGTGVTADAPVVKGGVITWNLTAVPTDNTQSRTVTMDAKKLKALYTVTGGGASGEITDGFVSFSYATSAPAEGTGVTTVSRSDGFVLIDGRAYTVNLTYKGSPVALTTHAGLKASFGNGSWVDGLAADQSSGKGVSADEKQSIITVNLRLEKNQNLTVSENSLTELKKLLTMEESDGKPADFSAGSLSFVYDAQAGIITENAGFVIVDNKRYGITVSLQKYRLEDQYADTYTQVVPGTASQVPEAVYVDQTFSYDGAGMYVGGITGVLVNGTLTEDHQNLKLELVGDPATESAVVAAAGGIAGAYNVSVGSVETLTNLNVEGSLTVKGKNTKVTGYTGGIIGYAKKSGTIRKSVLESGAIYSGGGESMTTRGCYDVSTLNNFSEASMDRWKLLSVPVDASGGTRKIYSLGWLCRDAVFSYTNSAAEQTKFTIGVTVLGKTVDTTEQSFLYLFADQADAADKTGYLQVTDPDAAQDFSIGKSGFLKIQNAYATDGHFQYITTSVPLTLYPYADKTESCPVTWSAGAVNRNAEGDDHIKVIVDETDFADGEHKFIYQIREEAAGKFYTAVMEKTEQETHFFAELPFNIDSMTISGRVVADGHIYEKTDSKTYTNADRAVGNPKVQIQSGYNYISTREITPYYTDLILSGNDLYFAQKMRVDNRYSLEKYDYYFYFSGNADEENQTIEKNGSKYAETDGTSAMVVPATIKNEPQYLHVLCRRKSGYTHDEKAVYAITKVTDRLPSVTTELKNVSMISDDQTTKLVFKTAENGVLTKVRYITSENSIIDQGVDALDLKTSHIYTKDDEISLAREGDENVKYLYVQFFDDSDQKCSELHEFTYLYRLKAEAPVAREATANSFDAGAASSVLELQSGESIHLTIQNAQSADTLIVYAIQEFGTNTPTAGLTLEIVKTLTNEEMTGLNGGNTPAGGSIVIGDTLYVKRTDGWDQLSPGALLYDRALDAGISLINHNDTNETSNYVITAMAIETGGRHSDVRNFWYKAAGKSKTEAPTADIATGAGSDSAVTVPRNTVLIFNTTANDSEMYYLVSNSAIPDQVMPGTTEGTAGGYTTHHYDKNQGIAMQGKYADFMFVKIIAVREGSLPSDAPTFCYRIGEQDQAEMPTSIPSTTADSITGVTPGQTILLKTVTTGAEIYYRTEGDDMTITVNDDGTLNLAEGIQKYTESGILIPENGSGYFTILAVACKNGLAISNTATFTFAYPDTVEKPYASVTSGQVPQNTKVTLGSATKDAAIHYEIWYEASMEKDPTISSAVYDGQPFVITQPTWIRAFAVKNNVKSEMITFQYTTTDKLLAPTASMESGSIVARGTVISLSAESGSSIYYTTDGSSPLEVSSTTVTMGSSVTIDGSAGSMVTVKAAAKANNRSTSDVATFTYHISSNVTGGITADLASGASVSNGTKLNLMTDISEATIYYTTNGDNPTTGSHRGTVVTLSGTPGNTIIVKAIAVTEGGSTGAMATFSYRLKDKPGAPSASPSGGTLVKAVSVALSSTAAKIYYTTDGTEPTINSYLYTEEILINKATTLMAIAVTEDGEVSDAATFEYRAAGRVESPKSSLKEGVVAPGTVIYLSGADKAAKIYYSTDGTAPATVDLDSLLLYDEEGITINRTVTIRAISYIEGMQPSQLATFTYTVETIPAAEEKQKALALLEEEQLKASDTSGLPDRRSQEAEETEEAEAVLLTEEKYQTTVTARKTELPDNATLITVEAEKAEAMEKNVKAVLGSDYSLLTVYDMSLYSMRRQLHPESEVEIGLPIPKKYANAAVSIVYIDDKNKVTSLETRRFGNMAYAKTAHFSCYALAAAQIQESTTGGIDILMLLAGAAAVTLVLGIGFGIYVKIKRCQKRLPE